MDSGTLAITKKLVIEECANFSRIGPFQITNYCWAQEMKNKGKCLYFGEKVKECGYFQNCVEPIRTIRAGIKLRQKKNGSRMGFGNGI